MDKDILFMVFLQINYGSLSDSSITINVSPAYVTYVKLIGVNMFNVMLKNNELFSAECHLVLYIPNSTWVNTDFNGFMELNKIVSVNIISSQMTGTCYICTLMTVHGQSNLRLEAI